MSLTDFQLKSYLYRNVRQRKAPCLLLPVDKPRGSKVHACSNSDLGEFLFWWRNCYGVKNRKFPLGFLEFPSVKFLKIWQRYETYLAFLVAYLSGKFVRQVFRLVKKKTTKTKKPAWQPLLFSLLKASSCQLLCGRRISDILTEGN